MKKMNGIVMWFAIEKHLKTVGGTDSRDRIAFAVAAAGLDSSTVGYGRLQGDLIDHVSLICDHFVREGRLLRPERGRYQLV